MRVITCTLVALIVWAPVVEASGYFMPRAEYGARPKCPLNSRVLTAQERRTQNNVMCVCTQGYSVTSDRRCKNDKTGVVTGVSSSVRCPPNSTLSSNGRTCTCGAGYRMSRIQNVCMKATSRRKSITRDEERGEPSRYVPVDEDVLRKKRFYGTDQEWAAYEASRKRRLAKQRQRTSTPRVIKYASKRDQRRMQRLIRAYQNSRR